MTNMHKNYAYQFYDFIMYKKKLRIDVCVMCLYTGHSKKAKQSTKCKHLIVFSLLQTLILNN
jgi:hypothetical protein